MVTTMADLDMSKDFDYSRWHKTMDNKWKDTAHSIHLLKNNGLYDYPLPQC